MTFNNAVETIKEDKVCRAELACKVLEKSTEMSEYSDDGEMGDGNREEQELAKIILDDEVQLRGNVNAIHNLSVEYAKRDYFDIACKILKKALQERRNSYNIDLLADYLKYSINSSDEEIEFAEECFDRLNGINKKFWNWRAFDFAIDYLISSADWSMDDFEDRLKEGHKLAEEYKKRFGETEDADKAYHSLANVYLKNGDDESCNRLLKEALGKVKKAPLCALQLADTCFKRGLYEEAKEYVRKCIIMNSGNELSVSLGYPYILSAECSIALAYLYMESGNDERKENLEKNLESIENDYASAKECLGRREQRVMLLRKQIDVLKKQINIGADTENYEE